MSLATPAPSRDLRDLIVEHFRDQALELGIPSRPVPVYPDLTCEPAFKYVGGKRDLLTQRPDAFPPRETVRRYHEPFVGGGALFFGRYAGLPAVLNDSNRWLAKTLEYLRDCPDAVIATLRQLVDAYNGWSAEEHAAAKAFYLVQREIFHAPRMDPAARSALVLFLIRAAFNGLWRVNRAGRFNVGWAKRKRLKLNEPRLRAASLALSSATVLNLDFEAAVNDHVHRDGAGRIKAWGKFAAQEGDFVFFDPPYAPVSKTASFNAYQAGGDWRATGKDKLRLVALMADLKRRGIRWTACDADTPETRELYAPFHVETVQMERAVNSRGDRRGPVSELLIRNWGAPATKACIVDTQRKAAL